MRLYEKYRRLRLKDEEEKRRKKEEIKRLLRELNYYDAVQLLKELISQRDWMEG